MHALRRVAARLDQPFADEIDAEHGQHQRDAGDDRQEGRRAQHGAAFGDHGAPGDAVGIAEPEEGERGLGQDRAGDDDRRQRQHRRQRVGQDFAKGDLQRVHADDARRGDIVALADRQHLGARDPRRAGPGAERDGEDDHAASEGPATLTKASASRKPGTVWKASVMRISTSSTRPPAKPASVPTSAPTTIAAAAAAMPTASEVRAPCTSPASTSRPSRSVPSGSDQSLKGRQQRRPGDRQRIAREEDRARASATSASTASMHSAGQRLPASAGSGASIVMRGSRWRRRADRAAA